MHYNNSANEMRNDARYFCVAYFENLLLRDSPPRVHSRDFDYHGIFSRFYDTDGEIFRQNRNLACVIYFGLSPPPPLPVGGGKKQLTDAVFTAASGI